MSDPKLIGDYVHVPTALLGKKERSFLFDIYLYVPKANVYQLEWKAHKKVSMEKLEVWAGMELTGFRVAVTQKNKKLMMLELGIKEDALNNFPVIKEDEELVKIKRHVLLQRKMKLEMDQQDVDSLIKNAMNSDNFLPLIEWTRKQVLSFDINKSVTVSNARMLAELLDKDNYHNRIAALTIQYAHFMGMNSQEDLADLFCASMLKDLGFVFLNYNFLQMKLQDISRGQHKDYWKHGAMSLHLMSKAGIEVSKRCADMINHHHETSTGSGFPNGLGKHQVEPITYVLGIVEAVVLYSAGKLQNHKLTLMQVLTLLRDKKPVEGLLPYPIDDYALFANFALKAFPQAKAAS